MKKISTVVLFAFVGLVALLLIVWVYLLSKNQKITTQALANATDKLDSLTDKLNDITSRDHEIALVNAQLEMLEIEQQSNQQPIGFKINEEINRPTL